MPELLLELFSEEIPARMQARAADDLKRLVTEGLKAAGLAFDRAEAFVTPRRLALVVDGLPAQQPDTREEKRGPRVDAPDKAIQGFLKGNGLTLEECERRETDKGPFLFAVKEVTGRATEDALPQPMADAVMNITWSKSMRWGGTPMSPMTWVRPLQRVLCMFDGQVVGLNLPLAVIELEDATSGHRFHAPDRQYDLRRACGIVRRQRYRPDAH